MATLKERKTCGQRCEDLGHFVWNPHLGSFMGRTPLKWVYISLYYVAFYVVMTGLFALSIYVLMYTISPYKPNYQDRLSSPGVMVWPDTFREEGVEITYNKSDESSYARMSNRLKTFLRPYNDQWQKDCNPTRCTEGRYFIQHKFWGENNTTKLACPFTQSMLGNCSGIDDPTFGYTDFQPCVIIKMNRIVDFLPNNKTGMAPYVNCTILEGEDNVRGVIYYPSNATFDLSYFPYYGKKAQPTYVNPLVAVKFDLVNQREAKIECRVVANNIGFQNVHDPFQGKVVFSLKAME